MELGHNYIIHSYKHNGNIHRAWDEAVFIEETDEYLVFGNNCTVVTEADGITWRTKEPAIMYFFKDRWYNIIAQMKKDGIYFYCNIATPFILEEGKIKYIDYDLDLRIFPKGDFKVLDKLEYEYHKKIMNYSKELDIVIKNALSELINAYKNNEIMFRNNINLNYLNQYLILKGEKNSKK